MMNVLSVMGNTSSCNREECKCSMCTRKKRLQMLGFSKEAVEEFLCKSNKDDNESL